MKVTSVSIKSFLGIEEKSVECGKITKISGRNASGKTSILQAIQSAIGGGSLAKMGRVNGQGGSIEQPEVVLVIDDGKFRVEKDAKGTRVKARVGDSAAYEEVKKPQTWLDSLFDARLSNPVKLLTAKPEDLADLILEALPLKLDRDELSACIGPEGIAAAGPTLFAAGHPLQVVAAVRQAVYDVRTGVNVSARDKDSSAYELAKTIPADLPEDPMARACELEASRDELLTAIVTSRAKIEGDFKVASANAQAAYQAAKERLEQGFKAQAAKRRGQLEEAIAALKAEAEGDIAHLRDAIGLRIDAEEAARDEATSALQATRTSALLGVNASQENLNRLERDLAESRSLNERHGEILGAKRMADKFAADAADLKARSERLTAALAGLDAFRRAMAEDIPIEGLEIEGKAIKVHGIPFEQLNQAQRIRILVKISVLRAKGQLPVVFVDGAEALDTEQQALLEAELAETGVQAFISSVEDHDLTTVVS